MTFQIRIKTMKATPWTWTIAIAVCLLVRESTAADSAASAIPPASPNSAARAAQSGSAPQPSSGNLAEDAFKKGTERLEKNDLAGAIAAFTEALRLNPNDAKALSSRGVAYDLNRDLDKALADYNEALRIDPKYATAYYNRGMTYGKKHDLDKAIADFTEAIRLKPQMAQAYFNRGMIYGEKGDKINAYEDLARAEKLGFNVPAKEKAATSPGNPWLTPVLFVAAVVVIAGYWFVRKRRLASAVHR
jgi:tetratricopeptide (TPR) repeat protein